MGSSSAFGKVTELQGQLFTQMTAKLLLKRQCFSTTSVWFPQPDPGKGVCVSDVLFPFATHDSSLYLSTLLVSS